MVAKLQPDLGRITAHVENSLMLVTALAPHIGYDKAVAIGKYAMTQGISLQAAATRLGLVSGEDFNRWVDPVQMT
jgi:fumarate hydratase class II